MNRVKTWKWKAMLKITSSQTCMHIGEFLGKKKTKNLPKPET